MIFGSNLLTITNGIHRIAAMRGHKILDLGLSG
jgi:hypothetical protein